MRTDREERGRDRGERGRDREERGRYKTTRNSIFRDGRPFVPGAVELTRPTILLLIKSKLFNPRVFL